MDEDKRSIAVLNYGRLQVTTDDFFEIKEIDLRRKVHGLSQIHLSFIRNFSV